MTGRRELTIVVVACLAGAGLALLATRQTWLVTVTERPAPFPAERTESTGAALRAWVPALAWTALAGAGALLATRAALRRLVGGLLALAGAGIAAGALTTAAPAAGWPAVAATGGLIVALAGAAAVVRGGRWAAMGSRYERGSRYGRGPAGAASGTGTPADRGTSGRGRTPEHDESPERLWDALDRGEDPTGR